MLPKYSAAQAQTDLPRLLNDAATEGSVAITCQDETVAYLISRERMETIVETLDVLGNAKAMEALHAYESGKMNFMPLSVLDEGEQGDDGSPA
jgi:PHD/YefM family antitoxin component YafN of YafNO toxin-antitoxin module